MKYLYLFPIILLAFTNVSCDFLTNKREIPPPVYDVTEDDIEAFTDVLDDRLEKKA